MFFEKLTPFLICLLFFTIEVFKSGGKANIGIYILSIYMVSFFGAIFLPFEDIEYTFFAGIYLTVIILMFLVPAFSVRSDRFKVLKLTHHSLFRFVSWFFILWGGFSIIYFVPVVIGIFFSGESFLILRTNMVGGESYTQVGIPYFIASLGSQFYPIVLILFFYSLSVNRDGRIFNSLLLISSTSYIFNVLTAVGRDGFVLWSMSFVFSLIVFARFMSLQQIKKIKILIFIMGSLFLLFFIPITISRFVILGGADAVYFSILSYASQQLAYFNQFFNSGFDFPNEPERLFPIINLITGKTKENVDFLSRHYYLLDAYGLDFFTFKTFVGDFYVYLGFWTVFYIALFFSVGGFLIFKNNGKISLERILLLTLFCQIPLHGVFYYKLQYTLSNIYMILVLLLVFVLYFFRLLLKRVS